MGGKGLWKCLPGLSNLPLCEARPQALPLPPPPLYPWLPSDRIPYLCTLSSGSASISTYQPCSWSASNHDSFCKDRASILSNEKEKQFIPKVQEDPEYCRSLCKTQGGQESLLRVKWWFLCEHFSLPSSNAGLKLKGVGAGEDMG